jgi:hypothetical protein
MSVPRNFFILPFLNFTITGTRNNAGECVALESLTFPSQVLPCSGSTGVISAFPFSGKAPRDMYFQRFLRCKY